MYRTQGLDVQNVSKLSQAAAHPRRGTYITRNGISCKEWRHATQPEQKKQRRKLLYFAIFTARNDASVSSVFFLLTDNTDDTEKRKVEV